METPLSTQIDNALTLLSKLELKIGSARQAGILLTKAELFKYLSANANYRHLYELSHGRDEGWWDSIIQDCKSSLMTPQLKDFLVKVRENLETKVPASERITAGYRAVTFIHPLPGAVAVSNVLTEINQLSMIYPFLLLALTEASEL